MLQKSTETGLQNRTNGLYYHWERANSYSTYFALPRLQKPFSLLPSHSSVVDSLIVKCRGVFGFRIGDACVPTKTKEV
jgi:hypothetical protein